MHLPPIDGSEMPVKARRMSTQEAKSKPPKHSESAGEDETAPHPETQPVTQTEDDEALQELCQILDREITQSERDAIGPANVKHIARSLLDFSAVRPLRTPLLRIYNPTIQTDGWTSEHTVLELVCDDQPFLLDSVLGALSAENLNIYAVLHPMVAYRRDDQGRRTHLERSNGEGRTGSKIESVIHVQFHHHSSKDFLDKLSEKILQIIKSVYLVVGDFGPMRTRLYEMIGQLESYPPTADRSRTEEAVAFLHWLRDNHFVFLGSRTYEFSGDLTNGHLRPVDESGLGLLRDPAMRIVRKTKSAVSLSPEIREFFELPTPIIITKSNIRSTIHRRVYMDYIGIKRFDEHGSLVGECRFVGLFTADAYSQSVFSVPLLSQKANRVLDYANTSPNSYNYKALRNILEKFPRDEMFQLTDDELKDTTLQILDLYERPRTRLFLRKDRFDRYASALIYVPRDRYSSVAREKIGKVLIDAFDGRISAYYPYFDDSSLARVQFIIGFDHKPDPQRTNAQHLEDRIIEVTSDWSDDFQTHLIATFGEETGHALFAAYQQAFTAGYREKTNPRDAVPDIAALRNLGPYPEICVRTYPDPDAASNILKFKIYRSDSAIALSDMLPILEHLGFRVLHENGFLVHTTQRNFWIHEFEMETSLVDELDQSVPQLIEQAFLAIWRGVSENDAFNQLVVAQGLDWRIASLFRALSRYQRQIGQGLSSSYIVETLTKYSEITRDLVALFEIRFSPDLASAPDPRAEREKAVSDKILAGLDQVQSLDEDRIFRRLLNLIQSIWRTNFYQRTPEGTPKPYISFKIDSRSIEQMPSPRPFAEIYVFSPRIEGIHLRWGKVARGGLRWSDRREDYRTEILGLVKAQKVKNAVIVPVGAKGGFVARNLDRFETPDDKRTEGIASYRIFISGLLDITDNFVNSQVIRPSGVVCHDQDDPYLVVAADKGTATFSDIANGMADQYGFWLGDAFASGGSNGYDHKKMGITARGGWEAVKRHFREMGKDIQSEPFTVAGVGDMSGDVFGNAMLLSQKTRLVAAFDHRHIFIDPDPDMETGFRERKRLFEKAGSSWDDYNRDLISPGGGIFPRSAKSIDLTPEIKTLLQVEADKMPPFELIRAILSAPVDLLWFGGIGTYIKSEDEHESDVGDRSNESVRVTAQQVRAKVIGEGANLGLTQKGRIALAMQGCKLNTDAIDNSAGVDCSDHEVNIKILLANAVLNGLLSTEDRNRLLEAMTEEVSDLVLKNNYAQTLTLSLAENSAPDDLNAHKRLIHALESTGFLDRAVEGLPNDEVLNEMELNGRGLTRPELAVLLAYAKLHLFEQLCATDMCLSDDFADELYGYFPDILQTKFPDQIRNHQLRKEITATVLANGTINDGGIAFINRLREHSGKPSHQIVAAKVIADRIFDLPGLRRQINALDNKVSAGLQFRLHDRIVGFLRRQVLWFLRDTHQHGDRSIAQTVDAFKGHVNLIRSTLTDCLPPRAGEEYVQDIDAMMAEAVPEHLSRGIAALEFMVLTCDICELSERMSLDPILTARTYFALGEELNIDVLRTRATRLRGLEHWDRLALRRVVEDFDALQSELTASVLGFSGSGSGDLISLWLTTHHEPISRAQKLLDSIETSGAWTVSKLALAAGELRQLALAIEKETAASS